jgi:ABC-type dipeptide/oligopeptide/nickel transport system permease component
MIQFLVKRFIGLIFVVICVTFITFIFGYLAPGDPIRNMLGQHFDPRIYASLRHAYHLDLPWYQQYWEYISGLAHFDLGMSIRNQNEPVWDILKAGVPVSAELSLWGLAITLLMGIPVGILSAIKSNTWIDTTNMGVALILFALPGFVIAVFFQVIVVWYDIAIGKQIGLEWPVSNWGQPWQYTWTDIQYKIGPILVFAAGSYAFYARLSRGSMLEVLRQDYVRTARAKGLRERMVVYRHALRNALIPICTSVGLALGFLIVGVFFIETIFNIPGIANAALTSISDRDYPVIQATTALGALAAVAGNLIADLLYTVVDPRIKIQ